MRLVGSNALHAGVRHSNGEVLSPATDGVGGYNRGDGLAGVSVGNF